MVHAARMWSRVRSHFRDAKFARMSSGTYCVIRDLGLVKGGKGMRHHEVLMTLSARAFGRWALGVARHAFRTRNIPLESDAPQNPENVAQRSAEISPLRRPAREQPVLAEQQGHRRLATVSAQADDIGEISRAERAG